MNIKEVWTEIDFEEMGWHDCHIHAISFPQEDLELGLDIDYLFDWILDDNTNTYKFWISPCILFFFNVINLDFNIMFRNSIGLNIQNINRNNPRLSPNKKITLWDFEIITDKGDITFESSGYKQIVKKQPILNQYQILKREKW